jgi:hypothetical protein
MARSVALVTPFAWSQPHDVNEHVEGLARELRVRGHRVTVLAPSNRARDRAAGRRALWNGITTDLVALGPAVPISRRSRMGVPVGVHANLLGALAAGGFDIVHGFEPGLPSLSYLALRDASALTVATFFSPERLTYPPARTRRERLLTRLDALLATSEETAKAAAERFPGRYELVPAGVDLELFTQVDKRKVVVLEWRQSERLLLRGLVRELGGLPDWELVLLRTRPLGSRPHLPRTLRGRVRVRTASTRGTRRGVPRRSRLRAVGRRCSAPSSKREPQVSPSRRRRAGSTSRSSPPLRRPACSTTTRSAPAAPRRASRRRERRASRRSQTG